MRNSAVQVVIFLGRPAQSSSPESGVHLCCSVAGQEVVRLPGRRDNIDAKLPANLIRLTLDTWHAVFSARSGIAVSMANGIFSAVSLYSTKIATKNTGGRSSGTACQNYDKRSCPQTAPAAGRLHHLLQIVAG